MRRKHLSKGIKTILSVCLAASLVVTMPFVAKTIASSAAEEEGEVLTGTSWWSAFQFSKDRVLKGNGSVSFLLKNNQAYDDNIGFCIEAMALNEDGTKYISKDEIATEEKGGYIDSSYNGQCGGWVTGIPAAKLGASQSVDFSELPEKLYNISISREPFNPDHTYKVTVTRTDQEYLILVKDMTTDTWFYRQAFEGVDIGSDIIGVRFLAQLGTYHMVDTQEHLITDTTESLIPYRLKLSPVFVTAKPGERVPFTVEAYKRNLEKFEGDYDLTWRAVKYSNDTYTNVEMPEEGVFTVPTDAKEGDEYSVYVEATDKRSVRDVAKVVISEKETPTPTPTVTPTPTLSPTPSPTPTLSPTPSPTTSSDPAPTKKPTTTAAPANKPEETPSSEADNTIEPSVTKKPESTKTPAETSSKTSRKKAKITVKKDGHTVSKVTIKKKKKTILKVSVNSQGKLSLTKMSKKAKKILSASLKNGSLTIKGKKKGKVTLKINAAKTNAYKKTTKTIKVTVK